MSKNSKGIGLLMQQGMIPIPVTLGLSNLQKNRNVHLCWSKLFRFYQENSVVLMNGHACGLNLEDGGYHQKCVRVLKILLEPAAHHLNHKLIQHYKHLS